MKLLATLPILLSVACVTAPLRPAGDIADDIVTYVDAGKTDHASRLFGQIEDEPGYPNLIYPVLFTAAKDRYGEGEGESSVAMLRFMSEHYPQATAVREALLFGLFLERAEQERPEPELLDELQQTADELRILAVRSQWLDLVETQLAIDQGNPEGARESFERFVATWTGQPESIAIYVEDLDRYLASH